MLALLLAFLLAGSLAFPGGVSPLGELGLGGLMAFAADDYTYSDGDTLNMNGTIVEGGTYYLPDLREEEESGAITVNVATADPVTIVGCGYDPDGGDSAPKANKVTFKCTEENVDVTFENVYLSTDAGLTLIDVGSGESNHLCFEGTCCLQSKYASKNSEAATIHIREGVGAQLCGAGTLYLWAGLSTCAGIGGSAGEANGTITFGDEGVSNDTTTFGDEGVSNDGSLTLLAMNAIPNLTNSGTNPIIGSATSDDNDHPGEITFNSGTYYLSRNSGGSAIEGPSGATSGEFKVNLNGASVYVIQNQKNDELSQTSWPHLVGSSYDLSTDSIGTLNYSAGSLLAMTTTLGENMKRKGFDDQLYLRGIGDAPVMLNRSNEDGTQLYPCYVDVDGFSCAGTDRATVLVDGNQIFDGSLLSWSVEETNTKLSSQPIQKWVEQRQSQLCLYLTPETHSIEIDGESVTARWDSSAHAFEIEGYANQPVYTYDVVYTLGGGTNSADNPSTYQSDTTGITLEDPTRTGFDFTGWTDLSGNATTGIAAGSTGVKSFTANWTASIYQVTYQDAEGARQSVDVEYGTTITVDGVGQKVTGDLTLPDEPNEGYDRRAWRLVSAEGETPAFESVDVDPVTYTITYVLNGGTNNPLNPQTFTVESPELVLIAPTRVGWFFDGWYAGTEQVSSIEPGTTGNITLEARWVQDPQAVEYAITYDLNGGENSPANPTSYTAATPTFGLLPATREGHDFVGWFDAAGTQVTRIVKGTSGDLALEARWQAQTRTITYATPAGETATLEIEWGKTYSVNGGAPQTVTADVTLPNPTRAPAAGFLCVGWDVTVDEQGNATFVEKDGKRETCAITLDQPHDSARLGTDGKPLQCAMIYAKVDGQDVKSVSYGTTVDLTIYPYDGYEFEYFTVDGVPLEAGTYSVTVTDDVTVGAVVRDPRSATVRVSDLTNGDVSWQITKTGVVYRDGYPVAVKNLAVSDGDPLYEEDVLTLTAWLHDGVEPADVNMTYLDEDGNLSPCRFQVSTDDDALDSGARWELTASKYAKLTDGVVEIDVEYPVEHQKTWLQLADTSWFDPGDPQTDYYLTTPEQLAGMVRLLNDKTTNFTSMTIHIARDISLVNNDGKTDAEGNLGRRLWVAPRSDDNENQAVCFSGTFDGGGHAITGLDIQTSTSAKVANRRSGLFAYAKSATFEDVTIDGTVVDEHPETGSLVAIAEDCSFSNVVNKASVSGVSHVGGIVGNVKGVTKLDGCRNEGAISYRAAGMYQAGDFGGIVGVTGGQVTISNCENSGTIKTASNEGSSVGGIVGNLGAQAGILRDIRVENCINSGEICVVNGLTVVANTTCAGGIIGFGSGKVTQCANYGSVVNRSDRVTQRTTLGGIIGESTNTALSYCVNTGDISVATAKMARLGGIAGVYRCETATFEYCCSTGSVAWGDVAGMSQDATYYGDSSGAGALVGVTSGDITVTSDGETTTSGSGGINLYLCYAAGAVGENSGDGVASDERVGALVGAAYGDVDMGGSLYLAGLAERTCGFYAEGKSLVSADAVALSESELKGATSRLNAGIDTTAFGEDILNANDGWPLATWLASSTVRFTNNDGSALRTVAVPKHYESTIDEVAACYIAKYGEPKAATLPEGSTSATFASWDNLSSGVPTSTVSGTEGSVELRAVYDYDGGRWAILYHLNGGQSCDGPSYYASDTGVDALEEPVGTVGIFLQWVDGSGQVLSSIAPGTTGTVDLYACWDVYVNKKALTLEISAARQLLNSVVVSQDGLDVAGSDYWVTADEYTALVEAIDAAQLAADIDPMPQSIYDVALPALEEAEATLKAARRSGKSLALEVKRANQLLDSATVSTMGDGSDVSTSKYWVTENVHNTLSAAIEYADGQLQSGSLTSAQSEETLGSLQAAEAVFSAAIKKGTKVDPVPSSDSKTTTSTVATSTAGLTTSSVILPQTGGTGGVSTSSKDATSTDDANAGSRFPIQEVVSQALDVAPWLIGIAVVGLAVGFARSWRKSHKYDDKIKQWM